MKATQKDVLAAKPGAPVREGWEKASQELAEQGDHGLVWPEFANEADQELKW